MTTVLPAFGRQYANSAAALLDWHNGKDFLESSSRRAANKADLPGLVVIRYGKKLEKVTSYDPAKDGPRIQRQIDKDRATRPVNVDFDAWMKQLDVVVVAEVGLSYQDLPDWDFRTAFDDGIDPKTAAMSVIADAF